MFKIVIHDIFSLQNTDVAILIYNYTQYYTQFPFLFKIILFYFASPQHSPFRNILIIWGSYSYCFLPHFLSPSLQRLTPTTFFVSSPPSLIFLTSPYISSRIMPASYSSHIRANISPETWHLSRNTCHQLVTSLSATFPETHYS